ncbi:hypothetical protein OIU76_026931 [Salix suchowensis]|nr:hypothetical protein OIU76_026931 [Salix suchowensis]
MSAMGEEQICALKDIAKLGNLKFLLPDPRTCDNLSIIFMITPWCVAVTLHWKGMHMKTSQNDLKPKTSAMIHLKYQFLGYNLYTAMCLFQSFLLLWRNLMPALDKFDGTQTRTRIYEDSSPLDFLP